MLTEVCTDSFTALAGRDSLGRVLPMHNEVGSLRKDRYVGMFYFLWLGQHSKDGPYDITKTLREKPEAVYEPNDPIWGPLNHYHHWGEPLFGYYFSDDEWVLRKHIQMLTVAGIDFLVFDTTNRVVYKDVVLTFLRLLDEYQQMGWKVPQIAFYTNTRSGQTIDEIYEFLYRPCLYPELWFQWDGKPLIVGKPDECSSEVRQFFAFRLSQWPNEPVKQNGFPWIEFRRPQHVYMNDRGEKEVISVSVAQHPQIFFGDSALYGELDNWGRSFHNGHNDFSEGAIDWGYNFQEQWEYAIEQDPQIIFVTGWNEWVAMRLKGTKDRPIRFVDQASQEFSRDVEPMLGGHFDNYYMQLICNIRKFKGLARPLTSGHKISIDILGEYSQWEAVVPVYRDFLNDAIHRNHPGFGDIMYTNKTGRNDFDILKVARDDINLYFYVHTKEPIQVGGANSCIQLFLRISRNDASNWEGYQFLVNSAIGGENRGTLKKSKGGWNWETICNIDCRFEGNQMHIAVPRELLGVGKGDSPFESEFKWADNVAVSKDGTVSIEDFYLNGDAAPYGRLNFVYSCGGRSS
jgi:hypothetical protein